MAQPEPTKLHVLDDVAFHAEIQLQFVAAERVIALGPVVGVVHGMAVPRTLAVVDNGFLVEFVDHQEKISFTLFRPATSASISPTVL